MSGLEQVCACWDMSCGVTYAASAQYDSVRVTACQVSLCVSSQQACCSFMTTHVCKISSCHSAMWVPTAKSATLQSRPSSLGLFSIPSYEKFLRGKRFSSDEKSRRRSRPGLKSSQKIFFQGDKVVATKVGEVYWVIRGPH